MTFELFYVPEGKIVDIYSVKYDDCGYPHFLFYNENQWITKSAKYFRPILGDDLYERQCF